MSGNEQLEARLRPLLGELYGDRAEECLGRIVGMASRYGPEMPRDERSGWDQRDVVLITYGDQVRREGISPLACLGEFLHAA
ncbi:MAG: hypothetical protein HQ582_02705, partial [Planctomycetes bacterium]|nr:hypothetical protein [Planctomycetota bacterium]